MPLPASQPVVTQLTIDASGASTGAAQYDAAMTRAEQASQKLQDAVDKTQAVLEQHYKTMNDLAAANDNVSKGWGGIVSGAENVGSSLEKTTANILNTINHLKLLALGIYAISPAFRSMINSAIPVAIGAMGEAAATAAKSVLSFAGPLLAFFASITAPIAVAIIAWKALVALWQQGADLLQKYSGASLYGSDVADNLKKLTQYQTDTISAAQVQYATELGDRLQTAKNTIDQFFKVQFDTTNLALSLQSIWVLIVETIAKAAAGLNALMNSVPPWLIAIVGGAGTGAAIGSVVPGVGTALGAGGGAIAGLAAYLGGTAGTAANGDPNAAAMKAARGRLGALMGNANIGTDGAPLGSSFATRFTQDLNGLANVDNSKTPAKSNSYEIALQGIKDQIDQLNLEADGASKTSQAVEELKVAHTLNAAAMKAGVSVTDEMRGKWKEYADQIAELNIQIRQQQALQSEQFKGATMFMSPADQAAANIAHQIDPTNWQAHMSDLAAQTAAFNQEIGQARDLSVGFLQSFNNDLVAGTVNMTTLTNAVQGLESKLLSMVENQAINQLFAALTGNASGGGFMNSLLGMFGISTPGAVLPGGTPAGQGGIGHAAAGGNFGAGDWSVVGENGPELVRFGSDASVIPNNKIAVGGMSAPAPANLNLKVNVIDNAGSNVSVGQPQSDGQGGFNLDVMIDKAVSKAIAKPGSDTANVLRSRGVTPQLTQRG